MVRLALLTSVYFCLYSTTIEECWRQGTYA